MGDTERLLACRSDIAGWAARGIVACLVAVALFAAGGCAHRATGLDGGTTGAPVVRLLGPVDLVPLAGDPDSVGLVVLLQVTSDRDEALVVDLRHFQIVQRTPESVRVIAAGRSASPLYVPSATRDDAGNPLPLVVRHTFRVDRNSWVPDMLDAVRDGELFLAGRLEIQWRGRVREADFQWQLDPPVFPWQDANARAGLFGGFRSLTVGFRDLDTLEFDAVVRLRDPVGSSLLLSDVVAVLETDGIARGLVIRSPRIALEGLPHQQDVRIRGTIVLKSCDPATLDRLAKARGASRLHITATASGDGLPPTRIDETLPVTLNASSTMAQSVGVPIGLAPLPEEVSRALFQQVDLADLARLEPLERERLLSGEVVTLPVRVRNPFPGTVSVRVARLQFEGPERYTQTGVPLTPLRVVLAAGSSPEVRIPPFQEARVSVQLRLTETAVGGSGHFFTKLLAGSDFSGYRVTQDIEIGIPLLGRIDMALEREVTR